MGIAYGALLYCHGGAEVNVDKKCLTLNYNNMIVYDCFNNPFISNFGSPALHLPPITIDDRPCPHKISCYSPDLLPASISVASKNNVSTLNTSSDYPDLLPSIDPNALHVMKKYLPLKGTVNREYCFRKLGRIICYKKTTFYRST